MSGWHCTGCGDKTAAAVTKLGETKKDATLKATADVKASTLTITYDDSKVTKAEIEEAIKATKYKVVSWK
jgi:copper chaperone CopZ